jgi:hypothetical protein
LKSADDLGKAAQAIGMPVEEFSGMAYAAKLADVEIAQLEKGIVKLSRSLVDAGSKPTGEAAEAFKNLGINVRDAEGKLITGREALLRISDRFLAAEDGAAKTAIAYELFGKNAAAMIPFLNMGRGGIEKLEEEAQKLGLTLSKGTSDAAQEFNDNMKRMSKATEGIVLQMTVGMLPALNLLSEEFVKSSKSGKSFETVGTAIGFVLRGVGTIVTLTASQFKFLTLELFALVEVAGKLKSGDFSGAGAAVLKFKDDMVALARETGQTVALFTGLSAGAAGAAIHLEKLTLQTVRAAVGMAELSKPVDTKALESYIKSVEKNIVAMQAETRTFFDNTAVKEKAKVVEQGLQAAHAASIPITETYRAKLEELGTTAGGLALKLEGLRLLQENRDPMVRYQDELLRTSEAMKAAGASSEATALALSKVEQKFEMTTEQMAASVAGTLKTITGAFAKEGGTLFKISQGFAIAEALINAYRAASLAFSTLPPPASYVAAAAALAKGLAFVASIKGVLPSFALGGAFEVPGGSSGTDNRLVPLNLASGERVEITPAAEVMGARTGGGEASRSTPNEIVIRGRSISELFTLDDLRNLTEALNAANRDGYRLKFAV